MSNVQRVFYVAEPAINVDGSSSGDTSHWVKFTNASGAAPSFPVNGSLAGVGTVTIVGMYGLSGRLFIEGETFESEGYARIYAPQVAELPVGVLDVFDTVDTGNTSFEDAVIEAGPAWFWRVDEVTGVVADNAMDTDGDLEYGVDASTYFSDSSLQSGVGKAKDIAGTGGREIYDPILAGFPSDWDETLKDTPFNYNYNFKANQTDGVDRVVYGRHDKIGEFYAGEPWKIKEDNHGLSDDTSTDASAVTSKLFRHVADGGKFAVSMDIVVAPTLYEGIALLVTSSVSLMNTSYNLNNSRTFNARYNGTVYNFGSYESSPTSNAQWAAGDTIYLFVDLDNDLITININGNSLQTSVTATGLVDFVTVTGMVSGGGLNEVILDYDPDLSAVTTFPAGTVEGDWTGLGDWTNWLVDYDFTALPNDVAGWSTATVGGPATLSQGANDSVVFTDRLTSPSFVAPSTGVYIAVFQLNADRIFDRWISCYAYVNGVATGEVGLIQDEAYRSNNGFGTNVAVAEFTATLGQTIHLELQNDDYNEEVSVKNCYLIRRR